MKKTVIKIEDFKKDYKKKNRDQKSVENEKKINSFFDSIEENINNIKQGIGNSSDLIIKTIKMLDKRETKIALIYLGTLVDELSIQNNILKPLMSKSNFNNQDNERTIIIDPDNLCNYIITEAVIQKINHIEVVYNRLLTGELIVLIEGYQEGLSINVKGFKERGVEEPTSQTVIRGPKDGFTESIKTNIGLIRNKLKDKNLWIETMQIGRRTQTDVSLIYINELTNQKIVNEVRTRLKQIDIDGILESGNIEELIRDHNYSLFPTLANTERPDSVVGNLLEGRMAILIDGTPFVLILPVTFYQFFQSTEDYYNQFLFSSFIRSIRFISFLIAMLAPSIYISLVNYHQEMIPTLLLINIAAKREGVPFPAFIEALLMELTFEILREAGVRMPRAVGGAISIVGALVIGEAAVQAGIVSPLMVIIVSITAISSFVFPNYNMMNSIRLIRFLFMILAVILGLYGVVLGLFLLIMYLCSIRSFGIPYMSPMAPFNLESQKDNIVRFPLFKIFHRPSILNTKDNTNQKKVEQ